MADFILRLFSLKGQSMRAWRWHRMRQVCLMLPLFTSIMLVNNVALALDWLFYPRFSRQAIQKPVFVVSLPRTGTTNLLHALNAPGMPFTSMKLWESLLAPSIVQKKLIRWCWKRLPFSLKQGIRRMDQKVFQSLNTVHHASLFLPEEDEMVLFWSLSTAHLGLFYPESKVMRDHFRFDELISERQKARIMRRYKRMIQRHLYALGGEASLRFLSKNPTMAAKVEAIAHHFPDGQAVVIERPPHNVLPSTRLLVETQIAVATDVPMSAEETQATCSILEDFRHNLQRHLTDRHVMPFAVMQFTDLVRDRGASVNALLQWLECEASYSPLEQLHAHRSKKAYTPLTDDELTAVLRHPWPSWPSHAVLSVQPGQSQAS